MQSRRGGRPSQVRPRPPSTGRPKPVRARPVAPAQTRLAPHRRVERSPGLPLGARILLGAAVLALGTSVLWFGSGGIGPVVSSLASAFGAVIDDAGRTAAPTRTPMAPVADAPLIQAPAEPLTNLPTVDIAVAIPADVVGLSGHAVRLYVTLPETPARLVAQAPVGPTAQVSLMGTPLVAGRNDFHATVMGPSGESDPSPIVSFVLDQVPPKVTVSAPKNNVLVNGDAITIRGTTQGRSTIFARNEANGATATTAADADGAFELSIAVTPGINGITVTATDPARNTGSVVVTVRKGTGAFAARLSASAYRIKASRLPANIEFRVLVTDPSGRPLPGARALFTITVPGLEAILSSEVTTSGDGTAVFRTRLPKGAQLGGGLASVLVTSDDFGTATDRQVLTIEQ